MSRGLQGAAYESTRTSTVRRGLATTQKIQIGGKRRSNTTPRARAINPGGFDAIMIALRDPTGGGQPTELKREKMQLRKAAGRVQSLPLGLGPSK